MFGRIDDVSILVHRSKNKKAVAENNTSHGAVKPTDKIIEEQADKWAFMFWNMGYEQLPENTPEAK